MTPLTNFWTSDDLTSPDIPRQVFPSLNRMDVYFWHICNRVLLVPKYHVDVPASVGLGSSRLVPTSSSRYLMLALPSQQSRLWGPRISLFYLLTLKFALIFHAVVCQLCLPHLSLHNRSTINSTTDGSSLLCPNTFAGLLPTRLWMMGGF